MKISDKERTEREKRYHEALAINSLGANAEPTEFAKELFQQYINGEIEQKEIIKILVEHYKESNISEKPKGEEVFEHVCKKLHEIDMSKDYATTEDGLKEKLLKAYKIFNLYT